MNQIYNLLVTAGFLTAGIIMVASIGFVIADSMDRGNEKLARKDGRKEADTTLGDH